MRPSKRLCVTILGMLITAALIWHAIDKVAALDPEHTDPGKWIATICSTCVGAMIAAAWKDVSGETARPSDRD